MFQSYQRWRKREMFLKSDKQEMYNIIVDHVMKVADLHPNTQGGDEEDKVRGEYRELCGAVWQKVIDRLPEELLEYREDAHKLLCGVIMVLFQNIAFHYGEIKKMLSNKTDQLAAAREQISEERERTTPTEVDSSENVTNLPTSVRDKVTSTMNTVPLEYFTNAESNIQQLFEQKYISHEAMELLVHNTALTQFIQKAGRLCWRLVTSDPGYKLTKPYQMHTWQEKTHAEFVELLEGSDNKTLSGSIQYYSRPVLLRGERVICKGSVYVHSSGN